MVAPGLAREFPALRSLDALPGNLPVQHSSFVGREREVAELAGLVREARIVTLTGVGGVGKTRLACQVAADVSPEFRGGAWLVELARMRDPSVVVDGVAAALGVTPRPGVDLVDTLVGYLRAKELLLVLDNCEHLLGAVVELVRALEERCPGLVVLSTSREGLGIAGERIVAVPSLGLPRSGDRDAVLTSDAARLLVERAIAVKSDFAVTDANAGAVAEVVRRLDGIPLALELAAARIPVLSPAQLAQRLDQRFRLLAGGERGAIERHATLRAAIDWSYDLLAADEQRVLARLSVFAGGCSLDAAEAVCSGAGIDEVEVLDLSPRWSHVRWWLQKMPLRGSVVTGSWKRSASTQKNGSTMQSAPSCATATPTSTSTSRRPPPKGYGGRTSCAGSWRSNRSSRTSAPHWHGPSRPTTRFVRHGSCVCS